MTRIVSAVVIAMSLLMVPATSHSQEPGPAEAANVNPIHAQVEEQFPAVIGALEKYRNAGPVEISAAPGESDLALTEIPSVVSGDDPGQIPETSDPPVDPANEPVTGAPSYNITAVDAAGVMLVTFTQGSVTGYLEYTEGSFQQMIAAGEADSTLPSVQLVYTIEADPKIIDPVESEAPILMVRAPLPGTEPDPNIPVTEPTDDAVTPPEPSDPPYPTEADVEIFGQQEGLPDTTTSEVASKAGGDAPNDGEIDAGYITCTSKIVPPYGSRSIYGVFVTTHKTSTCSSAVWTRLSIRQYFLQGTGIWAFVGDPTIHDCGTVNFCDVYGHVKACDTGYASRRYYWRSWETLGISVNNHQYLDRGYSFWVKLYRKPACQILV